MQDKHPTVFAIIPAPWLERFLAEPGTGLLTLGLSHVLLSPSLSSSWPFSIQDVVQPLTLRVQRPLVSVVSVFTGQGWGSCGEAWARYNTLLPIIPQTVSDASWISELLWSFFVPFTVYQVRY